MVIITRSKSSQMDAISVELDKKLDTFKADLIQTLTNIIEAEVKKYFEKSPLTPNTQQETQNKEITESINAIKERVHFIQSQQAAFQAKSIIFENRLEKLEQYTRRQNIRIFGVPINDAKEKPKDVEKKVIDFVNECGMDINPRSLDRAHRVGKKKVSKVVVKDEAGVESTKSVTTQPIIARFTSFRDRSTFYQSRKNLKNLRGYSVSLDLTYDRHQLLKQAIDYVEDLASIKFVYSDINCELRAFTACGKHLKFTSIADLAGIDASL